jgi:oligoribonuclease NrnB/cAMP/cGMP phosphodiesterase (DHH superfamily)
MVDFSLEPFSDMVRLDKESKSLVWIDHHKTAIEEYENWQRKSPDREVTQIVGLRKVREAGCELTWKHFIGRELPLAVKLLGRYDVWDLDDPRWDSEILPFQYGMRNRDNDPEDKIWIELLTADAREYVAVITATGKTLLAYEERQNAIYVKSCAFPTTLDGHTVIACNRGLTNSKLFDSIWDPEKYEIMAAFYLHKSGKWKVSLYTTREDVDCSEVAKARGGGGHRQAAGFICDGLPWRTNL